MAYLQQEFKVHLLDGVEVTPAAFWLQVETMFEPDGKKNVPHPELRF